LSEPKSDPSNPEFWKRCGKAVDRTVMEDRTAGFTTWIGAGVKPGIVSGASSGDSSAYVIGKAAVTNLTENQRKNPPVGSGKAIFVPFSTRLTVGDIFLAVSDGIWKYLWDEEIQRICRATELERIPSVLRQRVAELYRGSLPDDIAIIVVGT
jgi:serine/threonine protein phosphatase PrpC